MTVWVPGQNTVGHDNSETRHTGQRTRETTEGRCDMMRGQFFWSMASPGRHQAQSDAALQVGHRACGRRSWRHVNHLRLRRRVLHGRGRHPTPGDPALWTRAKTKAQTGAKGTTERAIRRTKEKTTSVISKKFPAREFIPITVLINSKNKTALNYSHYRFNYFEKQ